MKKLFLVAGLAHALLFVACATANKDTKSKAGASEVTAMPASPTPMPAFSLSKLGGGELASTELAGKPLLINFWHPA